MYCVYMTIAKHEGKYYRYIGSTSIEKINSGYIGSVSSSKWRDVFKSLDTKTRILLKFDTRSMAYDEENNLHIKYNISKNPKFINEVNSGNRTKEGDQPKKKSPANMSLISKERLTAMRRISSYRKETIVEASDEETIDIFYGWFKKNVIEIHPKETITIYEKMGVSS